MALVLARQAVERRRQFRDRHHTGHGRAALEGMQCPLQTVADRRALAIGTAQERLQAGQMA
ncbi:hypothetical protein D3C76_766280 [compost metagenome]